MKEFHGEGSAGIIASKLTLEGPIKKEKSSFIISGRRTYADLIFKPFLKAMEEDVNAGYYFYDLNAKINYNISDKDRVYLSGYFGLGYTDSEIKESRRSPNDVGNQAPLVSEYNANLGLQYRRPVFDTLNLLVRTDLEAIGPTWFYPDNFTKRDPVELVNVRVGLQGNAWSAMLWAKNLTDEEYNAEWSPGPQFFPNAGYTNNFVFKALPRRWGVDLTYRF